MDNNQKINDLQAQIEKLQAEQAFLKAEIYLQNLAETATFTNVLLAAHEGREATYKLRINIDTTMRPALETIKRAAKHYKNVDDSETWPSWKAEAYKQAKAYDAYKRLQGWL